MRPEAEERPLESALYDRLLATADKADKRACVVYDPEQDHVFVLDGDASHWRSVRERAETASLLGVRVFVVEPAGKNLKSAQVREVEADVVDGRFFWHRIERVDFIADRTPRSRASALAED